GKLDDVYLYTVDDLEGVIQENMQARQEAAAEAEHILRHFSDEFRQWQLGRQKHDTVRELQQKYSEVAQNELQRAKAQLANEGDPEQVMEQLTHRLTKKFLHQPLVWLRKDDGEVDAHEVIRQLFDLEDDN
ncbi:MAG: glutamyl-tRNA reductase, partial [Kangiella sp.]|nr:glutamyl-tRNA reductase [Kangiella sp.]